MQAFLNSPKLFLFYIFILAATGCLFGKIRIKNISLGTAGVLFVAIIMGMTVGRYPSVNIFGSDIAIFGDLTRSRFGVVSDIGSSMFITAVGLGAGQIFSRSQAKNTLKYLTLGVITAAAGATAVAVLLAADTNLDLSMALGLLAGALTSTPGLTAAKELGRINTGSSVAGYGIAYLFGIFSIVIFIQIVARFSKERKRAGDKNKAAGIDAVSYVGALQRSGFNTLKVKELLIIMCVTVASGVLLGSISTPGGFSLGMTCGIIFSGIILGHIFKEILKGSGQTLAFIRELGLSMFLAGCGVPAGERFAENFRPVYFAYGMAITLISMLAAFAAAKFIFRMNLRQMLGAVAGGMTNTPALGAALASLPEEEDGNVTGAYALTYPAALITVIICVKILPLLFS